ncbi:unnamed protein product [Rhodiola kirilowii]
MADKGKQTKTAYELKRKKNAPDKGRPAKKVKDITYQTSTQTFKVDSYASTLKRKEADACGEQKTRSEKAASSKQQVPSIDGHSANSGDDFVDNNLQIVLSNGVPKDHQNILEPKKLRYAGFETRTTPKPLTDCVKTLTEDQRLVVASMGLEAMLHLKLNKVRADLGEWVLESYDSKTSTLITDRGDVEIVPKDIHFIMGLPLGGRIIKLPGRTNAESPIVQQFRHQYGGPRDSTVSCQKIVDKIKQTGVADDTFKLNFLVLFFSSMVESTKSGTSNQRILNGIEGTDDIRALNWCEYILTCLRDTRDEWEGNKRSPYSGPITFLIALYIDMFEHRLCKIDRQSPAIKGIDDVVIAKRIKYETKQGGFSKGTTLLKRNEPASITQSVEKVSDKHRKVQAEVEGKKTHTKLVKDNKKDARIDESLDVVSRIDKELQREVRVKKTPVKDASIARSLEIVLHKDKEVQAEVGVKNTPFKRVTKLDKAAELLKASLENYNHAYKEAARQSNFKDKINKTNEDVWKCIDSYKEKRNQKGESQQSSKEPLFEEVNFKNQSSMQTPPIKINHLLRNYANHNL